MGFYLKRSVIMKMESIYDVKEKLKKASQAGLESDEFLCLKKQYELDKRIGVKKIIEMYEKEKKKQEDELKRLEKMKEFEYKYIEQGYQSICGIDEVGRGPLAGPVVAGAVILPKDCTILYINDSKKLSEKKRELLYEEIMEKAVSVGIGIVSPGRIDDINILQATYEAMRMAIEQLEVKPDILLNDAVHIPNVSIKQIGIIKGDAKSVSIAAASIVAKVTRDRMMVEYDKLYPGYGFARNKGYGSEEHIKALKEKGNCCIHRESFILKEDKKSILSHKNMFSLNG